MIDPLRLCVACVPLGLYALFIGMLNLRRRPVVVSGGRDTAALGIGVLGLVLIGPIELLAPEGAFEVYGRIAWAMLLVMYSLTVTLIILLQPPALVVYNLSLADARKVLSRTLEILGCESRWAGNSMVLPALGVELHVESLAGMRNTKLVGTSVHQSLEGWYRLEQALNQAVQVADVPRNPRGVWFLVAGLLLLAAALYGAVQEPAMLVKNLKDVLH